MSGDTNILAANTAALSSAKPTAVIKLYEDKNTGIYSAANRIESTQTCTNANMCNKIISHLAKAANITKSNVRLASAFIPSTT